MEPTGYSSSFEREREEKEWNGSSLLSVKVLEDVEHLLFTFQNDSYSLGFFEV